MRDSFKSRGWAPQAYADSGNVWILWHWVHKEAHTVRSTDNYRNNNGTNIKGVEASGEVFQWNTSRTQYHTTEATS